MALALTKTGDFSEAVNNCTAALQIDETSVKAYFLRSTAHMNLKNFTEAFADCKQAIKLDPSDRNLRQHWESVKKESQAYQDELAEKRQKSTAKIFQSGSLYSDREESKNQMPEFDVGHIQVFMDIQIGTEGQ